MKYFLSFAVCLITLIGCFFPQNAEAQRFRNPKGPEFWVGFMNNNISTSYPLELSMHIFSDRPIDVVIEIPGYNFRKTVHIENYLIYSFDRDPDAKRADILQKLEDVRSNVVQKNGIRVYSTNKEHFFLTLSNRRPFTFDVALALPLWAVNTDYLIPSYGEPITGGPSKSEFMLVAVEDSTEVDVIPRGDVIDDGPDGIRRRKGIPYTIKLNRGETYLAMSNEDLTGSSVRANKPISVFSGNQCTNVGGSHSCDHLFEAVLPLPTIENKHLYTQYILSGSRHRPSDVYRIMALEEGITTVKIYNRQDTFQQFTINDAGEYITQNIATTALNKAFLLESDKPVMVTMFNLGDGADGNPNDNNADPFMITLIPQAMAQGYNGNFYIKQNLPRNNPNIPWRHFLNLIHPIDETADITLNGETLTELERTGTYAYQKFAINGDTTRIVSVFEFPETMKGAIALRCNECIGYIYGFTFDDGYGTTPQIGMYPVVNVEITAVNPLLQNATEQQVLHIVPNPMGKSGNFELNLTHAGIIDLEIYDLSGKLHRSVSGNYPAGKNVIPFEQKDLPSGIYFIKVKTEDTETHNKMVIGQ